MEKVLAAGGLVFNPHNELLMIYKGGKWDLPKGHLNPNENLESCALREVREETGLSRLSITRFVSITRHKCFETKLNATVIKETHWFEMRCQEKSILKPQKIENIEKVCWVKKEEVFEFLEQSYDNLKEMIISLVASK